MHARVDALTPAVELVLKVQSVGEAPAGLEVAVQEAVAALERPFGRSVARVEDDPAERELPQKARNSCVGRPRGAIAPSRSQTSLPGRAPSRSRQHLIPHAMSGNSLEKTSAPAKARE